MPSPEVRAKLVLETSGGLAGAAAGAGGGASGGLGGAANGGASLLGSLGSIGKTLGIIAVLMKAFEGPLLMIGQIVSVLTMFLKPIADVVMWFLKPVLMYFLKLLIPLLQKWNQFAQSETGQTIKEGIGTAAEFALEMSPVGQVVSAFEGLQADIEKWAPIVETIKTYVGSWIESGWDALTSFGSWIYETVNTWLSAGWDTALNFYDRAMEIISPFIEEAWDGATDLYDMIVTDTVIPWIESTWEDAKTLYSEIIDVVSTWISAGWDAATTLLQDVTTTVLGWVTAGWDSLSSLSSYVWDTVVSWIEGWKSNIVSMIGSWVGGFGDDDSDSTTMSAQDALITSDGRVIKFDPNDTIAASKNGFSGGSNVTINVNVNALDASSIDSSTITKITSEISANLKRELAGKSSYGMGI